MRFRFDRPAFGIVGDAITGWFGQMIAATEDLEVRIHFSPWLWKHWGVRRPFPREGQTLVKITELGPLELRRYTPIDLYALARR